MTLLHKDFHNAFLRLGHCFEALERGVRKYGRTAHGTVSRQYHGDALWHLEHRLTYVPQSFLRHVYFEATITTRSPAHAVRVLQVLVLIVAQRGATSYVYIPYSQGLLRTQSDFCLFTRWRYLKSEQNFAAFLGARPVARLAAHEPFMRDMIEESQLIASFAQPMVSECTRAADDD